MFGAAAMTKAVAIETRLLRRYLSTPTRLVPLSTKAMLPHDVTHVTAGHTNASDDLCVDLYLDLLKGALTGTVVADQGRILGTKHSWGSPLLTHRLADRFGDVLARYGVSVVINRRSADNRQREEGKARPSRAETMIGLKRMDNIRACIESALNDDVPGDLIETGVWRGGATIFMRAVLKAHGDRTRLVWVADSFQGLPRPSPGDYPADLNDRHHSVSALRVSLDDVKENFRRYGLLDEQVKFLEGWFKDTLPTAPIERLAVLRMDGDMYESTMQALEALYPRVSPGGFCIVDDYALSGCRRAVDDYRERNGITEQLEVIDWTGVYWRKARPGHSQRSRD